MTQTNEELRKKICKILIENEPQPDELLNITNVVNEIMSLIPQPEQSKEPESNYVSLVNGSGTHCKECGKRL